MQLRNCLHPRHINVHGVDYYVPCGKCDICRYNRGIMWSERLCIERQCHKYCVFGTLTYADLFLPRMLPCEHGFYCCAPDPDMYLDRSDDGLYIHMPHQSEACKKFVELSMKHNGFIPYLSKYDFQTFFKRVRRKIEYTFKKRGIYDKEKFRISYALCGEYGPTQYRPHAHFNLYFDAPELAKEIKQILRSCWYYGSSSYKWVTDDNHSRYVSQYINSVSRLPDCFKVSEIRPFLLVSKRNNIGSLAISKEEAQRIIRSADTHANILDPQKGACVRVPLWSSIEHRFFPKFSGYDFIPPRLRAELYGLCSKHERFEDFLSTASYYRDNVESFLLDNDIQLGDYFTYFMKDAAVLQRDPLFGISPGLVTDRVYHSVLKGLFYSSRTLLSNMKKYGIESIDKYLDLIDLHDKKKALFNLKNMYSYMDSIDESDRVYIDMSVHCPESNRLFASQLKQLNHSIEHSHKNKRKHDYLNLHPEYKLIREYDEFLEGIV